MVTSFDPLTRRLVMRNQLEILHRKQLTITKLQEKLTHSSFLAKSLLIFGCAILTGIAAQIKIALPWTPVPITLQSLAVFFSATCIGGSLVLYSQALYLFLGLLGVPWFAQFNSGISTLLGPTGGYLLGFLFAGYFTGKCCEYFESNKNFLSIFVVFIIATGCLYLSGLLQLLFWYKMTLDVQLTFLQLLTKGLFPFVFGDSLKIVLLTLFVYYRQ
jgi:biotin transport system substrate-specific component